jgi:hypothetical protein
MDVLNTLFEKHFHTPVERVQPLQGQLGGSGRKIIRLSSETDSAIGVLYDVREENVAFLEFSRHFRRHGLPVPEIYARRLCWYRGGNSGGAGNYGRIITSWGPEGSLKFDPRSWFNLRVAGTSRLEIRIFLVHQPLVK